MTDTQQQRGMPSDFPVEENAFPFDPRDPVFRANPYPTYNALRDNSPVLVTQMGMTVLSRHKDCVMVLHHPQTSNDQRNSALFQAYVKATGMTDPFEGREPSFLFLDPPDHTRLRGLVSHAFTPRRVRDLTPLIEEFVSGLIDMKLATGEMEIVEDLAYPLPVRVICELLGVPHSDESVFKGWAHDLARALDPDFMIPDDVRQRQEAGFQSLRSYFEQLVAERRKNPGDDMLSALIQAEDAGDRLTHEELLSTLGLLLIAGFETTVNLIGNSVLQLGRHPEQYAKLVADPSLARSTIEEVLRFDPPVQISGRISMTDIEVDGHTITKGNQAITVLGAANRDPEEFGPTSQEFDITRANAANHVSFGAGIHFCVGAPLARLESTIAIRTLAEKVPSFEIAVDEPVYKENFVLRGLQSLPIRFQTAR
jgi:cytochrome P450